MTIPPVAVRGSARSTSSDEETLDSAERRRVPNDGARDAKARLRVAYPPDLSVNLDLSTDRIVLGRQGDLEAIPPIHHPTVSRAHFSIEWNAGRRSHQGRDLESRNGSWVGAEKAQSAPLPLSVGAVIRVGDVILVIEPGHALDERTTPEVSRTAVPGDSIPIRKLRAQLARAAPDVSPVLIIGDTGTGKEQIARETHRLSGRSGPFLAINCATFSEQIIDSQLFGHVKGSFTGATSDHPGLFRAAEGGTLFLDEIGEMPKELQAKLLRAIQEREVLSVGATKAVRVDVRVVAATHRHLAARARAGEFRQDLYARLALWELKVPSMIERKADLFPWIELLHSHWLTERGLSAREPLSFDADAAFALLLAPWPENLRSVNRLVHELGSRRIVGRPVERRDLPSWLFEGGSP